jgi:hypothetical protein
MPNYSTEYRLMTTLTAWMKASAQPMASSAVRRLPSKPLQKTDSRLAALAKKHEAVSQERP